MQQIKVYVYVNHRKMTDEGWTKSPDVVLSPEDNKAPKEQVAWVFDQATRVKQDWGVMTCSDHIVNGVRLAVKRGLIDPATVDIEFHGDGLTGIHHLKVDRNGSISYYPDGFMDTWNEVLMELMKD